jgi:hypothetical protein
VRDCGRLILASRTRPAVPHSAPPAAGAGPPQSVNATFASLPATTLWAVGCLALAIAAGFGVVAMAMAFDAAAYEQAPDCTTTSVSTLNCVAFVNAIASSATRRSYGIVVVTDVDVSAGGRTFTGDIVDFPWSATHLSARDGVVATLWQGRLTAIHLGGQVHHTWQNPYTTRLLLTWLSSAFVLIGLLVTAAYLTRVDIPSSQVIKRRSPWTQRVETLGLVVFLIVTVAVGSVASSATRFVLLAVAWAGLSAFLITALRGTALEWLADSERYARSSRDYATVTVSRIVLGSLLVAFIMVSAVGITRYVLA